MGTEVSKLTFREDTHEYRYGGVVVPGVTSMIERAYDFEHVPESIMEYKSALGTAVHKACELDDLGTLREESVDPAVRPYLEAWRRFTLENNPDWDGIEEKVYHPVYRYAGALDRRGWLNGKYGINDIKTSTTVHNAAGLQLAGYQEASPVLSGILPPKKLWTRNVIQLKPDGT